MLLTLLAGGIVLLCAVLGLWRKRAREEQREMEEHCITAEELHELQLSQHDLLLYDVRLPLDVLTDAEIIPGAQRFSPREIMENPSLISKNRDVVVYCTCPGKESSREVLHRALALGFNRVKFLRGGLIAWKAKGYPVQPYTEIFHLDVAHS
jgi:rhodanese-related sulfurtransferase